MLDAVNDHELGGVVDAVDDPVITAASRVEPNKFSDERLSQSVRILRNWTVEDHEGGVADLGWELVEVTEPLRGNPDLVHDSGRWQRQRLATVCFGPRPGEGGDELRISLDVEGFLERVEIVWAHQNEGGPPVASDEDPLMLALDLLSQLR